MENTIIVSLKVYPPSYLPDLNPIEQIWRTIKRVLSFTFIASLDEMKEAIADAWNNFSKKMSYAKGWVKKFLDDKQYSTELCG